MDGGVVTRYAKLKLFLGVGVTTLYSKGKISNKFPKSLVPNIFNCRSLQDHNVHAPVLLPTFGISWIGRSGRKK